MFISDAQWEVLKPVLEVPKSSVYGRPRANAREVFEAILFVLHTGIQWKYLPKTFPPKSTVHDYLQFWSTQQAFRKLLALVIRQVVQKGRVDLQQCFVDATFAAAKGGGEEVGLTRKGKGTKIQLVVDAKGIPLAVSLDAADRAECHMVQQTLAWEETDAQPERLIGDKAYDSDALDDALAELGIEMISPHRRNRLPEIKPRMDDLCAAIVIAGSSNAPSPGSVTTADCSRAGKKISRTFPPLLYSAVSCSRYEFAFFLTKSTFRTTSSEIMGGSTIQRPGSFSPQMEIGRYYGKAFPRIFCP